jgi:hypothetical protein
MSKTYFIGTLFTPPVQDHNAEEFEIGNFELPVRLEFGKLLASGDKPGLVMKTIGQHLAHAVLSTQSPMTMWRFQPSEDAKKDFNLKSVNFGGLE